MTSGYDLGIGSIDDVNKKYLKKSWLKIWNCEKKYISLH
jgi:hypothetical protein